MTREETTRAALASQFATVLAYRGGDQFAQIILLLDRIDDCYREEMLTVAPDKLLYKQGAAAQNRMLRDLLVETHAGQIVELPKV